MSPRVALVVPVFPKVSETFIVRHAIGLYERGWDLHVVCSRVDAEAWAAHPALHRHPDLRARVHVEPPTSPRWRALLVGGQAVLGGCLRSPATAWRYGRRRAWRRLFLDSVLVSLRPDLVHFEFGSLAPDRIDVGALLPARTVVSFRGYDLNFVGLDDPDHYERVWRSADGLHLLGDDLWRRAQRRGCSTDKLHALIPPAVDAAEFQPVDRHESGGPIRVVSVGRLEWKKGHVDMLRAIRRLVDEGVDVRYSIVGDGRQRPAIALARHDLGLDAEVELLGALPHTEIRRRLELADIVLHLSTSEGFGNAVLEAQAMAIPVVVSDADGLSENVVDGETGFVVPRRDCEAAARRLAQLARDPELRHRLGSAGRRRVETHFAPPAEIDAFEALYRRVLACL